MKKNRLSNVKRVMATMMMACLLLTGLGASSRIGTGIMLCSNVEAFRSRISWNGGRGGCAHIAWKCRKQNRQWIDMKFKV